RDRRTHAVPQAESGFPRQPPVPRAVDRGPAPDRQASHPGRGVRLHRRLGGPGDFPRPGAEGVRGRRTASGIPFSLSTLGTTSIEDVRATAPDGRLWYQLYVMKDLEISYGLVDRAAAAGFDTLLFTVDTPIAGNRMRDARNGFSIPPQLTAK